MINEDRRCRGAYLTQGDQRHVLAAYVHRYTKSHVPNWARGTNYRPQFASDIDWLANTWFAVRKDGRLDQRYRACHSEPTWPDGKGVNGQKGKDW